MKIGKDKVYKYYKKFKAGMSVIEIYSEYCKNKSKCGRHKIELDITEYERIDNLLDQEWSPDAICGRDKKLGIENRICTKTLYRMIKDNVFDYRKLVRKGKNRRRGESETRGKINNCKTIHQRDEEYPEVLENIEIGHFEGDTIVGKDKKSAIITLVDRASKYMILLKGSRKSEDVKSSVLNWLSQVPEGLVKTITFDRGKEFAKWAEIEDESPVDLKIYFGDPGCPGQRGLNENCNSIARRDLPKSTDLSRYTQAELNVLSNKYNAIPRKSINYETPMGFMEVLVDNGNILPVS
jgi:IS30 family transposase